MRKGGIFLYRKRQSVFAVIYRLYNVGAPMVIRFHFYRMTPVGIWGSHECSASCVGY